MEKSRVLNQLLNHSPSIFDAPGTAAVIFPCIFIPCICSVPSFKAAERSFSDEICEVFEFYFAPGESWTSHSYLIARGFSDCSALLPRRPTVADAGSMRRAAGGFVETKPID